MSHRSIAEKTREYLTRIENTRELNAFLHVAAERASVRAELLDLSGESAPLRGLVVAVKDNISVRGMPLSCGSRILDGFMAPYDATAITRLEDAGAVLIGKTNLDEFAMGSSTEHSAFGPTLNPLDLERVPGGSSGGSAAAVAADLCDAALGSDTGGSVRQPAAFCGVVGYKPTYGRVSRRGLVAFASSLDQIGVLAKDVRTTAKVAQIISGHDEEDSTSSLLPVPDYLASLSRAVSGLTIALPRELIPKTLSPAVRDGVMTAKELLRDAGMTIREISLPVLRFSLPCYMILNTAEASSNLARFDGARYGRRTRGETLIEMYTRSRSEGFGKEVKRRIMLGTFVLSKGYAEAYYSRAVRVQQQIRRELSDLFRSGVSLLLAPTTPAPAFRLGEKSDPLEMYRSDVFTVMASLAGLPAISVPVRASGLPVGVQLIAPPFGEEILFRVAQALEQLLRENSR